MERNDCRYGVLSSGTRTYFLRMADENTLQVSRRWYVSEPLYLRAWYWLIMEAERSGMMKFEATVSYRGDPIAMKDQSDNSTDCSASVTEQSGTVPDVPQSSLDELIIKWGHPVGFGRNGIMRQGCYQGVRIAVKQFIVETRAR